MLEDAQLGKLHLHLPAICLIEARKVIGERTLRDELTALREHVRGAREAGECSSVVADLVFSRLSSFEAFVQKEKRDAPGRIAALRDEPALRVFPLDESMLEMSLQIASTAAVYLQSFDLSILAAILVAGRELLAQGHELSFCTLDRDLQPWDRNGQSKRALQGLYDNAGIWVYRDFLLATPKRPAFRTVPLAT